MKFTFNTRRLYSERGQIIVVRHDERYYEAVMGYRIRFHDTSRNIKGCFFVPARLMDIRRIANLVMLVYDYNVFLPLRAADEADLTEDANVHDIYL